MIHWSLAAAANERYRCSFSDALGKRCAAVVLWDVAFHPALTKTLNPEAQRDIHNALHACAEQSD